MATEEIEISELELAEELSPDNLIPIESLTDTKATTLQKIKEWLGSFFVSLTKNEEILGLKIFKYGVTIKSDLTDDSVGQIIEKADIGSIPSTTLQRHFRVFDNNKRILGEISSQRVESGSQITSVVARNSISGEQKIGRMYVSVNKNGEVITYCPMSDVSHSILTTEEVLKEKNGYLILGNGVVLQWGTAEIGETHINFSKPFSTTSTIVCPIAYYNSASQVAFYNITTTGCDIRPNRSDYLVKWLALGW